MKVLFAAFDTDLTYSELAGRRAALARLLRRHDIELATIRKSTQPSSAVARIVDEARGGIVVAIDDACPFPDRAGWFKELAAAAGDLRPARRPRVIYLSKGHTAAAVVSAHLTGLCRQYVLRDPKGAWVSTVAQAVAILAKEIEEIEALDASADAPSGIVDIVGRSECFCEAILALADIVRSPYGLVTGETGVGKMYLIRSVWRQVGGDRRMIVLPCGTFFKDYYVGASRRRFGGGRESVDQLEPYLREAEESLLVLHHIERLPQALQEELSTRLEESSANLDVPTRLVGVDSEGLSEHDLRVIATSTYRPSVLRRTGRITADLLRRLTKRHVRIPSLRRRGRTDIALLSHDILARIAQRNDEVPRRLHKQAVETLAAATWPENISGLLRTLEYANRKCRGKTVHPWHLPPSVSAPVDPEGARTLDAIVQQAQRTAIANALDETNNDVPGAAGILKRNPKALYRLMKKLGIRT